MEEHVAFTKIYLSALLAIAALGCTDDGDDVPEPSCQPECVGDDICTEGGCEPAFERDYRARLTLSRYGQGFEVCRVTGECQLPYVAVYLSGKDAPILESTGPASTEIGVTKGSSLGIDFPTERCDLELTAARLRAGSLTCGTVGVLARVSMDPMPL